MLHLQHNVVNMLYAVKSSIESYLDKAEDAGFSSREAALEDARLVMKRIYGQTDRALAVTKRISSALKTEVCPVPPAPGIALRGAWEEALRMAKSRYSFEHLEILNYVPLEYPAICCRRRDLVEIFYLLMTNAAEAMNLRGKLIIRAALQFSIEEKPLAVITISDTGPGIAEDVLRHLFEPFFTTKPPDEGNGLGLCLVRGLAKRNGGTASVSSFKGCGAVFTLTFPAARGEF